MSEYVYKDDNLLMREGVWELRTITSYAEHNLHSYIVHECPLVSTPYYWWHLDNIDKTCYECKKHPPTDIMGLWKLHNFDYIQAGGDK